MHNKVFFSFPSFPGSLRIGVVLCILLSSVHAMGKVWPADTGLIGNPGKNGEPFPGTRFSIGHYPIARLDAQLNYKLAGVAARMHLYPLAMRLFLHSLTSKRSGKRGRPGEAGNRDAEFFFNEADDLQPDQEQALRLKDMPQILRLSPRANLTEMIRQLADSTGAVRYAIIIQVKQPEYGKRRIFKGLGNVGHSFITLIRYNQDNSVTSFSFGLYPKKNYPLAGSPFFPVTPPVFRDDRSHDWDEMVGKFISRRRFTAICRAVSSFEHRRYNLNNNNCTGFALAIGNLSGISFTGTQGRWPFGSGDNPACLGQSILAGTFANTDTQSREDLFVQINRENIF